MYNHRTAVEAHRHTIRLAVAQAEDIPALQATASACWVATYSSYLSASFIKSFLAHAYSTSKLLAYIADPQSYFVVVKSGDAKSGNVKSGNVKSGDELIGFGQVGPTMTRRDPAPVAPADLYRLYLLPAWQRQGIGSQLLGELEAWLRRQGHPFYGAYVHERAKHAH